jgi:hypothetical protein
MFLQKLLLLYQTAVSQPILCSSFFFKSHDHSIRYTVLLTKMLDLRRTHYGYRELKAYIYTCAVVLQTLGPEKSEYSMGVFSHHLPLVAHIVLHLLLPLPARQRELKFRSFFLQIMPLEGFLDTPRPPPLLAAPACGCGYTEDRA